MTNVGAIVGGVLGGILVVIISVLIYMFRENDKVRQYNKSLQLVQQGFVREDNQRLGAYSLGSH